MKLIAYLGFLPIFSLSYAAVASRFVAPEYGPAYSGSVEPFNVSVDQGPSVRYQEVFSSSVFSMYGDLEGTSAYQINGIYYLPETVFNFTLPNVEIRFCTTSKNEYTLSQNFAENIIESAQLVFSGALSYQATEDPGSTTGPKVFVPFYKPFIYTFSEGNLLMEVKNFQTLPSRPFPETWGATDGRGAWGDGTASVYSYDVNAPSGHLSTVGIYTGFIVTAD